MTREEIIENLGTIAHSGTGRYLAQLTGDDKQDSQLIGQFGVGFYSAFIVAETVEVTSRKAGRPAAEGVRWRSDGKGEYTLEPAACESRGTVVKLVLKTDATEFLEPHRVRALIRKYSDHIAFPVVLGGGGTAEPETVNQAKALWTRPRTEIGADEYREFYKHVTHDLGEPLTWSHNRVEGKREYTSLLYVPGQAPFDLWNRDAARGIKFYVQRVFITDDATQFLPSYLRFIRGVLDAGDVALNVSREVLQQDEAVAAIRGALTKRVLDMLEKLANDDPDKYATFWAEFGAVLKEGLAEDPGNAQKIAGLLRFNTTRSQGAAADRSLSRYLEDATADQDKVFYLLAESPAAAAASPHLEALRTRDIEVLLLSDRLDPWIIQHLPEYAGKPLRDVTRGALDLPGETAVPPESDKDQKHLLKRVKRALRERVDEVHASTRLKDSPVCLVAGEHDIGHRMRELLAAAGHDAPVEKPSLELNLDHPLVRKLETENNEQRFERLATILLDQAYLAEGRQLEDPAGFVRRLNDLLAEVDTSPGPAAAAD
jgi:molecular chaperone HtpG